MSDLELERLQNTLQSFTSKLSTTERTKVMRDISRSIRQNNQKRIQEQKNPDGTAYAPRKSKKRDKKGRIRRKMFTKLRTARFLKTASNSDSAELYFGRSAENIAKIHHYGLRERIKKTRTTIQNEKRELLGVTDHERQNMIDIFLDHLSK